MVESDEARHRRIARFFNTFDYLAKRLREAALIALLLSFVFSITTGREGPFFPILLGALVLAFLADGWTFIHCVVERLRSSTRCRASRAGG